MNRLALLACALFVGACDFKPDNALDLLSGREVNLVVLAQQPLRLTSEVATFTFLEPIKIIGESTTVCFALRGEVPLQDSKVMEQLFTTAMQGSKVSVAVILASGDRVTLHQPLQAWRMYGRIIKTNELSACASTPCKAKLPAGAQVARIEVSAEPALQVQGVYWESEHSPLEASPSRPKTAAASAPKASLSCAA